MRHLLRGGASQVALILVLFTLVGAWHFRSAVGEDLSSSYVGCRIMAVGEGAHLYAHDPVVFSIVRDPVWNGIAEAANFAPLSLLHPYVQTPLWAYALEPMCTRTDFRRFCHIFLVLEMMCASGTLWLVARNWAPTLLRPVSMILLCVGLAMSDPFRYAMFLTQTHVLFVFLSVLALVLAQKNRPVWAGLALALAAAVKITPGLLLIYWLLSRRYKAALSFAGFSAALIGLTVLTTGPAIFGAYLKELSEVSKVLLIAFNNQSLAAWWMGRHAPMVELFDWRIGTLPPVLRWTSGALVMLSGVVGGWMDRDEGKLGRERPPYGAILAMIGSTSFTPIAWSHYSVLLVIPVMLLVDTMRKGRALLWGGLATAIYALTLYPIAYGSVRHVYRAYSLVRSEFYSGVVCLIALLLLHWTQREPALPGAAAAIDESGADPVAVNLS